MRTLYDALHGDASPEIPLEAAPDYSHLSGKEFARAVLDSREFKQYVSTSLKACTIPSAILTRLMDYAWGKPPERVELTGKDGKPIEQITEIRRVIVRPEPQFDEDESVTTQSVTH